MLSTLVESIMVGGVQIGHRTRDGDNEDHAHRLKLILLKSAGVRKMASWTVECSLLLVATPNELSGPAWILGAIFRTERIDFLAETQNTKKCHGECSVVLIAFWVELFKASRCFERNVAGHQSTRPKMLNPIWNQEQLHCGASLHIHT